MHASRAGERVSPVHLDRACRCVLLCVVDDVCCLRCGRVVYESVDWSLAMRSAQALSFSTKHSRVVCLVALAISELASGPIAFAPRPG